MMEEFKILVSEVLTPHASAILLDPEWGLPAAKRRAKNAGLLLASTRKPDTTKPVPDAQSNPSTTAPVTLTKHFRVVNMANRPDSFSTYAPLR